MKIAEALKTATHSLQATSSSARLDAELLLAFVLGYSRSQLRLHESRELNGAQLEAYQRLIERRQGLKPVAYLLECQEFWSLSLTVNPAVLVPRPETEHLVETALALIQQPQARVADLGTGSGAIALSLAIERPQWQIVASDISLEALAVAKHNATTLHVDHIDFRHGSWTDVFHAGECFDAIVSNPPYLSADDPHLPALIHEPKLALVAAEQGLAAYRAILTKAQGFLKPGGYLILEHGCEQADAVQHLLRAQHFREINTIADLAGLPRVSIGRKS